MISARDVRVWYGTTRGAIRAVDGVSFDLKPGETLGLVGESGCGKSTLGRGLMGLLPEGAKRDGEVMFKGNDILSMSAKESYRLRGHRAGDDLPGATDPAEPADADLRALRGDDPAARAGPAKDEVRKRALEVLRLMGIPPTRYSPTRTSSPAGCASG